jgi:hypothetical protein
MTKEEIIKELMTMLDTVEIDISSMGYKKWKKYKQAVEAAHKLLKND